MASLFIGDDDSAYFQLFGVLKLSRVLRLSRFIAYLNVREDLKVQLKLYKLIFFWILYLHCFGCAWWFIVTFDGSNEWMPPLDYVWVATDIYE